MPVRRKPPPRLAPAPALDRGHLLGVGPERAGFAGGFGAGLLQRAPPGSHARPPSRGDGRGARGSGGCGPDPCPDRGRYRHRRADRRPRGRRGPGGVRARRGQRGCLRDVPRTLPARGRPPGAAPSPRGRRARPMRRAGPRGGAERADGSLRPGARAGGPGDPRPLGPGEASRHRRVHSLESRGRPAAHLPVRRRRARGVPVVRSPSPRARGHADEQAGGPAYPRPCPPFLRGGPRADRAIHGRIDPPDPRRGDAQPVRAVGPELGLGGGREARGRLGPVARRCRGDRPVPKGPPPRTHDRPPFRGPGHRERRRRRAPARRQRRDREARPSGSP